MVDKLKILITTIQPVSGGVPSMLRFILSCLADKNCDVTLAYYEPYSVSPQLSVPIHQVLVKAPTVRVDSFDGIRCVGVGCRFPELEFCHNWLSKRWGELISKHDIHLMVSGSVLAAQPYWQSKIPFMAWVATDWEGDREHRARQFPWYRKIIDHMLVSPVARRIEKNIVKTGRVVSLSNHTASILNKNCGFEGSKDILYMPVDIDRFVPIEKANQTFNIGLVARFEDPRKNLNLLLESLSIVVKVVPQAKLFLVGDEISNATQSMFEQLGIDGNVSVIEYIDNHKLPELLNTFDVFALPSFQEGLCIAALEAMSCGVPVVSTKCGGPEDFIRHGDNGLLSEFDAQDMASSILQLFANEKERKRYAMAARATIVDEFSLVSQKREFNRHFEKHFGRSLPEN